MSDFLQTCLTFPTLLYSIVLAFCAIYWLLASTGLVDTDAIDGMLAGDAHAHVHVGHDLHHHHGDGGDHATSAGMLARLGLSGVPIMVVLTVLSFFGWLCTYFVHLLVLSHLPASLRLLLGIATLLGALVPGLVATSLLLRPVSKLIHRLRPPVPPSILGKAGTVISPHVDERDGRAEFDDGGAGLILQVRAAPGTRFQRGDRVVLLSHDEAANAYAVISESEFHHR